MREKDVKVNGKRLTKNILLKITILLIYLPEKKETVILLIKPVNILMLFMKMKMSCL